ncbi:MAG: cytochrome c3 family protein [Desulfuromonas sp.]|nr:cytochrome c3 family protein [Desulfuromonas sp.]
MPASGTHINGDQRVDAALRVSAGFVVSVLALLVFLLCWVAPVHARVTGPCSNCHTMHYSQNNSILSEWDEGGPHQALLRTDCGGCHTGTNEFGGKTPFVMSDAPEYGESGIEANATTLAGGSFYWVNQPANKAVGGEATGHNVAGLTTADSILHTPPGFDGGRAAADGSRPGGGTWPSGQQVTCAGVYGCHGTHSEAAQTSAIHGAHHGDLGGARINPGNAPAAGYRFLVGIEGYEDPNWEIRPTADAHNQYKGLNNPGGSNTSTISSLCARCHGAYHSGTGNTGTSSPWLRHPTDYDMGNASSSEYRNYGGMGNSYNPAVPLASETVTSVKNKVTFSNDTIVTCLSCHRAHGSKYYKAMRWNYAGSVNGGLCTECHSSKK